MNLILCLLLPLAVASDVPNTGQRTRDVSRPQRRQQRIARVTTTTTTEATISPSETTVRAIGADFVPREIFKFELSDAKVPDFHQQQRYQTKPNSRARQRKSKRQQTSTESNAPSANDQQQQNAPAGDQSSSDSRVLTITHPVASGSRGVKQLPFSVQKAINHALKQDMNIPFLDTVKYYFKDPTAKSPAKSAERLPVGAKLFSDSRIRQWWQLPPSQKLTNGPNLGKVSVTTAKPLASSATFVNDYVAYPLLRTYPVQYSMNVASDLVNGVGFLYGDRIYSKPYTYQKNINAVPTADIKPVVEPKPYQDDDNIVNGVFRTTQSSILSTSPVVFPTSSESPKSQTFIKYYSAEPAATSHGVPTNPDTGEPLSNDKATIHLINKAVNELKKHNPHLNVVPKRLEKDELVVHVTPKPEYFSSPKVTTVTQRVPPSSSTIQAIKDIVTDKNLVYLNKVANSVSKPHIAGHAFVTHVEVPSNFDDLVESGYAFGYRVRDYNTGNDFGHTQKRMTDGTTMGEYKILMPDGRTQNVKYKADDNGYQADVSYDV